MTHNEVESWSAQVTRTVIAEVRRCRKELGMTAQDLADACDELGHPIPRNVIANWESGRRLTLTVPELLVLAKAVDTPPAALVFPLGGSTNVDCLPHESRDPWTAFSWFTGEDLDFGDAAVFREYAGVEHRIRTGHHDAWQLQFSGAREDWPHGAEAKLGRLVKAVRSELVPIRHRMRELGLNPPPLPGHLAFLDTDHKDDQMKEGTP
ncbi:helix-turn-helix domain-containing protein [Kitasatospora sp. NPDC057904]|uniref:helix-turn-helix domain-containing protein n=1 Tax=Kitasatospora sp. NPDC057904 TaxID=3346275 RepID=UPI0036DEDEEC